MVLNVNIVPTHLDVRWAHDVHCRVDILKHPTRSPDGNMAFVYRHGGGGINRDKRLPWVAGGTCNLLANYLMAQPFPVDFWSVESPQAKWGTPISAAHLPTTTNEVETVPVLFPKSADYLRLFAQWAKFHAFGREPVPELGVDLGHNPSRMIGVGSSYGACLWAWTALGGRRAPRTTAGRFGCNGRFGPYPDDSSMAGLVLFEMPIDLRNLGGVDQTYWGAIPGLLGAFTLPEWLKIPAHVKAAASPLAYLQAGETANYTPQYVIHEDVGNHVKPYGDPATGGGANVHDGAQWGTYTGALAAANLSWAGELTVANAWSDETEGPLISARVLSWARGVVGI